MGVRKLLARILLVLVVAVDLALAYRMMHPQTGLPAYRQLRQRIGELQEKVATLDASNRELSAEIRALREDEAYIRRLVRRELLYAADGEIMYIMK